MKKEIEEGTRRGKTFHVLELAELILWRWLYYKKQSIDSVQFPSNSQCRFLQKYKNQP
jgi:hypothetical protein